MPPHYWRTHTLSTPSCFAFPKFALSLQTIDSTIHKKEMQEIEGLMCWSPKLI